MRTSNGFDRISTEEELSQVLAVLDEFAHNGWALPGEDFADPSFWADAMLDDPEALAQLIDKKPELTN